MLSIMDRVKMTRYFRFALLIPMLCFAFHSIGFAKSLDPLWFAYQGESYEVGYDSSDIYRTTCIIEDSAGITANLSADAEAGLCLSYQMVQIGYLKEENLQDLQTLRLSMLNVSVTHVMIKALEKFQEEMVDLGVDGTAAYFSGGASVAKSASDEALEELKDAIVDAPDRVALAIGMIAIADGAAKLQRISDFVTERSDKQLGQSANMAFDCLEVQNRYIDAVGVDVTLIPAGEMLQELQADSGYKAQFYRLTKKLGTKLVATFTAKKYKDTVEIALDGYSLISNLRSLSTAYQNFASKVENIKDLWRIPATGLGDVFPAGFDPEGEGQSEAVADSQNSEERGIVAVVDSSGSMSSTDPAGLRLKALKMLGDRLGEQGRLGVIEFSTKARVVLPIDELGSFSSLKRKKIKKTIGAIGHGGNTNIRAGLLLAADAVSAFSDRQNFSILLLSDGADSKGWKGESDMIPAGVPVHTIALSDGADREGLSQVSAATGGIHEIALTAEDLPRIMGNLLDQASGGEVLLVESGNIQQGDVLQSTLYVDPGTGELNVSVSWPGSDVDLNLIDPDGKRMTIAAAVARGTGVEEASYDIIKLKNPTAGRWLLELLGVDLPQGGEAYTLQATAQGGGIDVDWQTNVVTPEIGQPFNVELKSENNAVSWDSVEAETIGPDGQLKKETLQLDSLASALGGLNGQTMQSFSPQKKGVYHVKIVAQGQTTTGDKIMRTFDRTFEVVSAGRGVRYRYQIDPFIPRRSKGMLR
jgi:hypothetical protein